ncbi:hypothetical protein BU26DRAFT_266579 [Trematosphaeria pertusa]|uniref:Uncharacterized protein n=1 Tax=Trematosphaeria pertusa TaxID=390896 RepID=A0A6A6IM83_9PLEO|nr:uncharacterized protein BU26DRAFT_266579 [Trematosphaeria pertusa]KAF2250593.1 hypothetical protein BU26DRAFT_266579 [Trematosphaeria pertusa]
MATTGTNTFALSLEAFISGVKRDEDIRSPFYKEVLSQLLSSPSDSNSHDHSSRSSEQLALYVKELDKKQKRSSYTRRISERLDPLLTGLSQYTQACDVMIQAGPAASAVLYGGARIVLMLAEKFRKCFEDVLSMMESVGDLLKCYHVFAKAYEASADMQRLLVETYKNIVSFWQKAAALFSRKAYKTLLTGIVKPLDAEWQRCRQTLEADAKKVQMLAQATEADLGRERDLAKSTSQQSKLRSHIVDWIKAGQEEDRLDVRQDIRTHLEIRHDESCEWLFQHPTMEKWLAMKKSTSLWYNAAPGAGKTILSSTLVRKLQEKGYRTATFFCSFNDFVRKKAINVLRSIALQILTHSDSIPERVQRLYEEDLKNHCSKLNDPKTASEIIEALLKQQSRIHIIIDGLDECEDRGLLLLSFCHLLHAKTYGIAKFFFASRPDSDIRTMMRKHNVTELEASGEGLTEDIRRYVTDRIDHECDSCVEYWTSHAQGNFLWVRHMMDILDGEGATCEEEIEEELDKFPKGLTGAYTRSLSRLLMRPERHQQLARSIFTMLVGAAQPLHLSELTHALAALKGIPDFSPRSLPKPELIEELCSNLVLFDRTMKGTEDDPLLKVAHKSVQDFFVQDPDVLQLPDERLRQYFVSPAKANLELGLSALSYLSYERYHATLDVSTVITANDHSFLRHAATFWHGYLSNAERSEELYKKIIDFTKTKAFWACVAVQTRVVPYLFATYTKDGGRYLGGYHLTATAPKLKTQCVDDVCFAIPLPEWLDTDVYGSEGARIFKAFHNFVTEWHPLLNSHPAAVAQCAMDDEWDGILPGRAPWRDERVKMHKISQGTSPDALVDIQLDAGSLKALTLAHRSSSSRYHIKWSTLPTANGSSSSDPPRTATQLICAPVAGHSYFFGGIPDIDQGYWLVDTARLSTSYYSSADEGVDASHADTYTSERTIGLWQGVCKVTTAPHDHSPTSHRAIAIHCMRDLPSHSDTMSTQSSQESGYGSMSSSDIESDSDADDDSPDTGDSLSQHCMFIVRSGGAPIWHFWKSKIDMDAVCAFHPTEATAVWSPSPHQLCIMDIASGNVQSTILPEPVDTQVSTTCAMRKEFKFSESGKTLYYLLYTAAHSDTGFKQTLSLSSFLFCSSGDPECVLERTHATVSVAYESAGAMQHPLILTYWDSNYVYVALPPLSCNTKLLRMHLPKAESPSVPPASNIQTLRDPVYFPYSTPYRSPQLKLLPNNTGKEMLILALDAEYCSTAEAEMTTPPVVMTWDIPSEEGWRPWDENLDAKEKGAKANGETYELLRGSFVDRERRFEVPVRSGLDWRRKAFLSCH